MPYHGLSESEIYNRLQVCISTFISFMETYIIVPLCFIILMIKQQMREGPRLTKELEEFFSLDNRMKRINLGITCDADADKLKLMIELFYQCTKGEPSDRPAAEQIYSSLCSISSKS